MGAQKSSVSISHGEKKKDWKSFLLSEPSEKESFAEKAVVYFLTDGE